MLLITYANNGRVFFNSYYFCLVKHWNLVSGCISYNFKWFKCILLTTATVLIKCKFVIEPNSGSIIADC